MARQEELIAQTIANMKRAMLRKADDSESDHSIKGTSNRGNKLKRKAKYVEEGRLDLANSYRANRRKINYNGYYREIISRNPLRVDPDGDVVDPDEDDQTLELEDFDEDPYQDVRIEKLLRPLTSAADLKTHPTLSAPYTSKVIDEMLQNARDTVFREEQVLWRIKKLFSEFRGDSTWMPVGDFESENDLAVLGPFTANPSAAPSVAATDGDTAHSAIARWDPISDVLPGRATDENTDLETNQTDAAESTTSSLTDAIPHDAYESPELGNRNNEGDSSQRDHQEQVTEQKDKDQPSQETSVGGAGHGRVNGDTVPSTTDATPPKQEDDVTSSTAPNGTEDEADASNETHQTIEKSLNEQEADIQMQDPENSQPPTGEDKETQDGIENEEENGSSADEAAQPPHRMTTRAKAQAATSPNPGSPQSPSTPHFIHPLFLPPPTAISTREFGLPYDEADETRRLLWAYVQKQEEICRAANRLCNGLLKAQRLRDDVLEWCQAEGHIGEMSDGEDWYDREKWGLEQDLKKGEELDEEDTTVSGKKTRHRRTARDA